MGKFASKNKVIGVNARFLLPNIEGIGRFTAEILKRITTQHPDYQFIFFFDRAYDKKYLFSDNITPVVLYPPARHPFLWYIWFEMMIPRALKKHKVDVFLTTDGYTSLSSNVPSVVVIHDLAFEHFPEQLPLLPRHFLRYFTPKYAQKATHIATVSEYSKQDLVKQYQISPSKITVTPNAASNIFQPLADEAKKAAVRQRYANGQSYFLFVGAIHPRKNIGNLLLAFDEFKKATSSKTKLLIGGRKAWKSKRALDIYEKMAFRQEVIFLGRLDISVLIDVIGAARAMTFVSVFEGFGLPILEAMHCDVPVITSNVSSMPEVAEKAALLINPHDVHDIAAALIRMDAQPELREELVKKGRLQRLKYSWRKSSDMLWEIILNIITKKE